MNIRLNSDNSGLDAIADGIDIPLFLWETRAPGATDWTVAGQDAQFLFSSLPSALAGAELRVTITGTANGGTATPLQSTVVVTAGTGLVPGTAGDDLILLSPDAGGNQATFSQGQDTIVGGAAYDVLNLGVGAGNAAVTATEAGGSSPRGLQIGVDGVPQYRVTETAPGRFVVSEVSNPANQTTLGGIDALMLDGSQPVNLWVDTHLINDQTMEVTGTPWGDRISLPAQGGAIDGAGGSDTLIVPLTGAFSNLRVADGPDGSHLLLADQGQFGSLARNGNGYTLTTAQGPVYTLTSLEAIAVQVDGQNALNITLGDTPAWSIPGPALQYALVNYNTLLLNYDEPLDAAHAPATGAFAVSINGSAVTVNAVAVDGNRVSLAMGQTLRPGDTLSAGYTDPSAGDDVNAIQDAAGNDAASLGLTGASTDTWMLVIGSDGADLIDLSNTSGYPRIEGRGGDDLITGTGDSDVILGGDGNDSILYAGLGWLGRDAVDGGAGLDTLTIDASAALGTQYDGLVTTAAGTEMGFGYSRSDFDSIRDTLALGEARFRFTLGGQGSITWGNIERLNLTATNYNGDHYASDLLIFQGTGGSYHGGAQGAGGYDAFYADWSNAMAGINWINDPAQIQTVNGVSVSGLERLLLITGTGDYADEISNLSVNSPDTFITGGGNDRISAGGGDDRIEAGAGDDRIDAGDGNDTVLAGDGDDSILYAGAGQDTLDGGAGFDTLTVDAWPPRAFHTMLYYSVTPAAGTAIYLDYSDGLDGIRDALALGGARLGLHSSDIEGITWSNIERFNLTGIGNSDDLLIYQGTGGSYNGGSHYRYDTFYADWSNATAGIDWANDPNQTQTVNGVGVSGLEQLLLITGAGDDRLSNLGVNTDDTFITGGGNDRIDAGGGNDRIEAGAGDDRIDAGDGNDTVLAGDGNDTLSAGGGNDRIEAGAGADTLDGGAGADRFGLRQGDSTAVSFADNGAANLNDGDSFTFNGGADLILGSGLTWTGPQGDRIEFLPDDGAAPGLNPMGSWNSGLFTPAIPGNGQVTDQGYFLVRGGYDAGAGLFTADSAGGADTLLVYDGDRSAGVSQTALVVSGIRPAQFAQNGGTLYLDSVLVTAAPVITSNGGGASAALGVVEGTTAVTQVTATDLDSTVLRYRIAGGEDASQFGIDAVSGVLTFNSAPDHGAPSDAGGDNRYDVTVQVSDGANSDTQALAVTVETAATRALTIGAVAGDDMINAAEQGAVITGTAEANATVALTLGGTRRTLAAGADGAWSYHLQAADIAAMGQGSETLSVIATGAAGDTSDTRSRIITVDTLPPALPVFSGISPDTGASATDGITNASSYRLAGTAEPGSTVLLYWPRSSSPPSTGPTADASGVWQVDHPRMLDGRYAGVTMTATDAAGNVSEAAPLTWVVDSLAPALLTAMVNGTVLTLTYNNEALDTGAARMPGMGQFGVQVGGAAREVTGVAVAGNQVRLTLAGAVASGEAVTVSYSDLQPGLDDDGRVIQDVAGNDAAGLTDQIVINQTPGAPGTSAPSLGTNLTGLCDWSSEYPFINHFSLARPWLTQGDGSWDTDQANLLDLDADGWVRAFTRDGSTPPFDHIATILFTEGSRRSGRYILDYEGEGSLIPNGAVRVVADESRPGRLVLDLLPPADSYGSAVWFILDNIDPNHTGDYIRNIRLYQEEDADLIEAGVRFRPEFLAKIENFRALRFMDWMGTNDSLQQEWSDRPTATDVSWAYYTGGAPVEVMVALANETRADPWFNIPHKATDEYIREFVTYVRDHLEPGLVARFEYSNEMWNWMFRQTHWAQAQAPASWGASGWMQYYGVRAADMARIVADVFGEETGQRALNVFSIGGWGLLGYALDAPAYVAEGGAAPSTAPFHVYAIASYFGGSIGGSDMTATVAQWIAAGEQGFQDAIQFLRNGGGYDTLDNIAGVFGRHADVARSLGWQFESYEGGQHVLDLDGGFGGTGDPVRTQFFIDLVRRPEFADLYREYFEIWRDNGGGLMAQFSDMGAPGRWGSWGLWESVYSSDNTPRAQAVIDWLDTVPTWWADDRPAENFANGELISGTAGGDAINGGIHDDRLFGLRGDDTLTAGAGDDLLHGGAGDDALDGGAGTDTASFAGAASGVRVDLFQTSQQDTLGAGLDTLRNIENLKGSSHDDTLSGNGWANVLEGGFGNDTLSGGRGDDVLNGGAGDDILRGGIGNDTLIGGAGHDSLSGGIGADTFVFNSLLAGDSDIITDFVAMADKIALDNSLFTALTEGQLTLGDFNTKVIYEQATGSLSYDADGAGGADAVLIAQLGDSYHPLLTAQNIIVI